MSITPAFSPGPWITQGAVVGRVRRWIFEDLYEQCSFHIAEKMPSSVMRRLAADQLEDALVLVGLEAVLGDQLRRDLELRCFGGRAFSRHRASHGGLGCVCSAARAFGSWYPGGPGTWPPFSQLWPTWAALSLSRTCGRPAFLPKPSCVAPGAIWSCQPTRFRRAFDLFADFAMGLNVIAGRGPAIRQFDASTIDGLAGSRGQARAKYAMLRACYAALAKCATSPANRPRPSVEPSAAST